MNDLNIIHEDLHAGDIMFDKESNKFWPIDISNIYECYYNLPQEHGTIINNSDIDLFHNILKLLEK